jgi:hypothetical protein
MSRPFASVFWPWAGSGGGFYGAVRGQCADFRHQSRAPGCGLSLTWSMRADDKCWKRVRAGNTPS